MPDGARHEMIVIRAEAEERIVPEAGSSAWRLWLARNYHLFEPPALSPVEARSSVPAHLLDPVLRAKNRELYKPDVDARLSLLLRDPDDRVRGAAAISLARAGLVNGPADAESLFRLLGDDQRRVRDQALLAASLAEGSAASYHLLRFAAASEEPRASGSESEKTRLRVLSALFASMRGQAMLADLVGDLALDRKLATQHRALVLQAIGLAGNRAAAPLLVSIARDRAEASLVRAAAVTALGALEERSAAPAMIALLEDRDHDAEVRAAAALAVGSLVGPNDSELVRSLVRTRSRENNAAVARFLLLSLGRIGGIHAEVEVMDVFERKGAEERVFAELALGLLARSSGAPQKVAPLLEALRSVRIQDERCALLCALGLSAQAQAIDAVANEALHDAAPEVRRAAVVALELLGRPACLPVLQKILIDDDSPDVRVQAARALARLDPAAASSMIHALGGSRPRGTTERAALILCLGFTRDPSVLEPLLDLLREQGRPSQEREAATLALGLVYDERRAAPAARLGESRSFLRESSELPSLLSLAE
jgi:HEAT repeat protein